MRIIGGRWRGRRIPVAAGADVRPTPDRVRETLFNWIQPFVPEAQCLDLFAGSGVLGLEALSRGARRVVMVDADPGVVAALGRLAAQLGTGDQLHALRADVLGYLAGPAQTFDIVFLDPPYGQGLLAPCCARLEAGGWLRPGAHIYLEAERAMGVPPVPAAWEVIRSKTAGQVGYHLARRGGAPDPASGGESA